MKSNVLTKNYVVNESIIQLVSKFGMSFEEFIVLLYFLNDDITFNLIGSSFSLNLTSNIFIKRIF